MPNTPEQKRILIIFNAIAFLSCALTFAQEHSPIDENATAETKMLFRNLEKLSENHILFGHHNATDYGHGWWGDKDRSDVKSVCGSHPAVIGEDFSGLSGGSKEMTDRAKEALKKSVVDTYNRGGITTIYREKPLK